MGSPYRTHETVCAIRIPEETHEMKAQGDEGDMKDGWNITVKDVERLRQFLTATIHTLPNLEPVIQPYIPLVPVHDEKKVVREKEQDYDGVMQPLTPQTVHITPPNDDYVAPATNPILDKQLNEFGGSFLISPELPKRQMVLAEGRQNSRPSQPVIMCHRPPLSSRRRSLRPPKNFFGEYFSQVQKCSPSPDLSDPPPHTLPPPHHPPPPPLPSSSSSSSQPLLPQPTPITTPCDHTTH
ncbi:hypothetical protein Tco_0371642 [Tanacetum coccineum]